ncbi:MAG: hypothetical protein JRH20_05345 [Deltaproteobacteria bacterium]|nr:hypothetical protein [Deltaproteobacteria bacterium]
MSLVAGLAGEIPRDRAMNVRLGEKVTLWAVVTLRQGGRTLTYSDAPRLRHRRRLRSGRGLRPLSELNARFRWIQIEPRPHHVAVAPPNDSNPAYSNAILFGPRHGRWLGYDTLEYQEQPIKGATRSSLVVQRTHPAHPRVNVNGGLGTMRYKVELRFARVELGVVSSPGSENVTPRGLSPRVTRVTFRSNDHWVGFLRGYFNVPNVFGSAGHGRRHQTDRYQGADCADVIVGALRAAGARLPYTSARGLLSYARPVTKRLLLTKKGIFEPNHKRPVKLVFGRDVRAGDIMLIDYVGFAGSPRSWDHVAVLYHDRGERGVFDAQDPILHMGYLYGLTEEHAAGEAPAHVQILRLKPHIRRKLERARRARKSQRSRRAKRLGIRGVSPKTKETRDDGRGMPRNPPS